MGIKRFLGLALCLIGGYLQGSAPHPVHPVKILFVLDASGSMGEKWNDVSKLDLSKKLLTHALDSLSKVNHTVQFALRVFGHQYDRGAYNCKDTKLEVPFSAGNAALIKEKLATIQPRGQTPIAYALYQAASDFDNDSLSEHAVILITDGDETCQGDPCAVGELFAKHRIAMKPFIIGLALNDSMQHRYDCLGYYYNVQDAAGFSHTMGVVMGQALNNTTAQLNLLDTYGQPTTTNVVVTLSDHYTHRDRYDFVHSLDKSGNPDTLYLDPTGRYDITVHTTPPVAKENVELIPGKHTQIAMDVPTGLLQLKQLAPRNNINSPVTCIVRETGSHQTLAVQDVNSTKSYIAGTYDLEILTLPKTELYSQDIVSGRTNTITLPQAGVLVVNPQELMNATLFMLQDDKQVLVWDFGKLNNQARQLVLLPGDYYIIYRPDKGKHAAYTQRIDVKITSGQVTPIRIN